MSSASFRCGVYAHKSSHSSVGPAVTMKKGESEVISFQLRQLMVLYG